jgi:hypothetical protein
VIDASPFPRTCPANGGCVDMLAPPQTVTPPDPNAPQEVPPSTLKFRTGSKTITPDDEDKVRLATSEVQAPIRIITSLKVCADATGKVTDVKVLKHSGLARYDKKIVNEIESTWSFEPYIFGDKPIPFCSAITFIYTQK